MARAEWLDARQAELLEVPYFHLVFTLPASAVEVAFHNKATVYGILFRAASEALRTVAADPRYLGAEIGAIAVLHTWGSAMMHHPHLHCIVPGGGLAFDHSRWIPCRPDFFLPVRTLSRCFREIFLDRLQHAFEAGALQFPPGIAELATQEAFATRVSALHQTEWVVFAKPPFATPDHVLAYLGRYTHRVAIANSRLVELADGKVSFTWKDYRDDGKTKIMTLAAAEFIRRFLQHTVPDGFHRIRYFGFLINSHRAAKLGLCRQLLAMPTPPSPPADVDYRERYRQLTGIPLDICPDCGGHMRDIGPLPRTTRPRTPLRCDTS